MDLVGGRNVNVPSITRFLSTLNSQFEEMKSKLVRIVSAQMYVCCTCDIWSSRAQSFMGMTLHYLTSVFRRVSIVIGFREMPHKQINKEITDTMLQILNNFDIPISKVTHIVTDGGSSFCKSFKIYGKKVDAVIDVSRNTDDNEDNNEIPFIQYDDGEGFCANIFDFNTNSKDDNSTSDERSSSLDSLDDDSVENNLEENDFLHEIHLIDSNEVNICTDKENQRQVDEQKQLPSHRRCLSHLLNLVGPDFEKALKGKYKAGLSKTLEKLQSIWVFPRRSSHAKTLSKEILGCSLTIPVETRWNSKYDSVKKVLSLQTLFVIQSNMNNYIHALKTNITAAQHLQTLEKEDWGVISIYIKV